MKDGKAIVILNDRDRLLIQEALERYHTICCNSAVLCKNDSNNWKYIQLLQAAEDIEKLIKKIELSRFNTVDVGE